jgi:hypothetical protein
MKVSGKGRADEGEGGYLVVRGPYNKNQITNI